MKGLCHSCLTSGVDVTVDKIDSCAKCKNCIGKPVAYINKRKEELRKSDKERYGFAEAEGERDISTHQGANFVDKER